MVFKELLNKAIESLLKILVPLKPFLKPFNPSFAVIIISIILYAFIILFLVFSTDSSCKLDQTMRQVGCNTTTMTGLPFWLNAMLGLAAAYIIGSISYYVYYRFFYKSYLK